MIAAEIENDFFNLEERFDLQKKIAETYPTQLNYFIDNPTIMNSILVDLYTDHKISEEERDYIIKMDENIEKADKLIETILLSDTSTMKTFLNYLEKYTNEVKIEKKLFSTEVSQNEHKNLYNYSSVVPEDVQGKFNEKKKNKN
jgi:hypothetical protein